jgi:hypothetical protein
VHRGGGGLGGGDRGWRGVAGGACMHACSHIIYYRLHTTPYNTIHTFLIIRGTQQVTSPAIRIQGNTLVAIRIQGNTLAAYLVKVPSGGHGTFN